MRTDNVRHLRLAEKVIDPRNELCSRPALQPCGLGDKIACVFQIQPQPDNRVLPSERACCRISQTQNLNRGISATQLGSQDLPQLVSHFDSQRCVRIRIHIPEQHRRITTNLRKPQRHLIRTNRVHNLCGYRIGTIRADQRLHPLPTLYTDQFVVYGFVLSCSYNRRRRVGIAAAADKTQRFNLTVQQPCKRIVTNTRIVSINF